jgi:hypothetical protein
MRAAHAKLVAGQPLEGSERLAPPWLVTAFRVPGPVARQLAGERAASAERRVPASGE